MGITGLGVTPYARLIGGTVRSMTGPIRPITIEKKMAGFSWAAQRM